MKYFLPLLICSIFVLGSCKKNNDSTPQLAKVKTTIIPDLLWGGPTDTATYSYNSEGKVSLIEHSTGSHTVYSYNGSTVSAINYDAAGAIYSNVTYYLNAQGYADSSSETYAAGNHFYYGDSYDASGMLLRLKYYGTNNAFTGTTTYTNDAGNNTDQVYTDTAGTVGSTYHYVYFTEHLNTMGNENKGMLFLGKSSKNLVNVVTFTGGGINNITSYTYDYDSQNRVVTQHLLNTGGTEVGTYYYSYY